MTVDPAEDGVGAVVGDGDQGEDGQAAEGECGLAEQPPGDAALRALPDHQGPEGEAAQGPAQSKEGVQGHYVGS